MTGDQSALFPDTTPSRVGNGRRQCLILPKYLTSASSDVRLQGAAHRNAYEIIIKWADLESSGKLFKMKETSLEGEFLVEVFGKALGYTLFSENLPQWQLRPKFAVQDGEADAAIGFFSPKENDPPRVLIELKGPKIDLDRHRSRHRTPVEQCWAYLDAVPQCPWGIVCNYVSFRLYHRNKTRRAYELFTLQQLRDPARFREFYVLFERGGFLPALKGQKPRADELLERTENQQREVGKKLYKDYHENRIALIKLLRRKPHEKSLDAAIHIVQTLMDRIIFIAFCEDRELLPSNTIKRTWQDAGLLTRATNPKWRRFVELFRVIDKGNESVTAFNGGLFAEDDEVDNVDLLSDDKTAFFHEISTYDFHDEVNVDVLGRLFEQSVTDLEALRTTPMEEEAKPAKVSGKRKREGIYYTPPHITRYIVEQTVGPWLASRYAELAAKHQIDPDAEPSPKTLANWVKYNKARLDVLRSIRIADPACGSGAFLSQAYDYLEGAYDEVIDALCLHQGKDNEPLREDISRTILRENLFGVDLSNEAVEITRLALWILTAKRGKSLSDLSHNIQPGNSLVDDAAVDARAFDWKKSFPHVFAEGGFHCVIGNPPYVKLQNFRRREPKIAEFLVGRYRSAQTGNFDMYLPFIERGIDLLRPGGRMGFIAPNVWLFNEYGGGLRQLVAEKKALHRFVDFKSYQVFEDATTYTALQFFSRDAARNIQVADASQGNLKKLAFYGVSYAGLGDGAWALLDGREQSILDKMRANSTTLEEASGGIIVGIQTSADAIYHLRKLSPGKYWSEALQGEVEIEEEIMKPLVSGEDAVPFATPPTDKYLLFPYVVTDNKCRLFTKPEMDKQFKRCWSYLQRNEKALRGREHGKMDHDEWFGYVYPKNLDKQEMPKIGLPQTVNHLQAFIDPKGERYFNNVRVNGILPRSDKSYSLWYLLALLNSRALDYCFRKTAKPKDREYYEANKQFIAPLPIPKARDQKPLAELAKKLADAHAGRLTAAAKVHRRFVTDLPPRQLLQTSPLPPSLTGRLHSFDETPLAEVIDDMEKLAQRRLKPAERTTWDEYLTKESAGLAKTKRAIADLQAQLNKQAYSLYGLTADEIKTIEDSPH